MQEVINKSIFHFPLGCAASARLQTLNLPVGRRRASQQVVLTGQAIVREADWVGVALRAERTGAGRSGWHPK